MGDTISVGDLTAIPAVQRQVTPGQVSCFDYLVYCKLKHGLMSQVYSAGLETFIPEFYNLITCLLTKTYKRWGSPGRKQRWQLLTDTDGVEVWPNLGCRSKVQGLTFLLTYIT